MAAPKTDEAAIRQTVKALIDAGYQLDHVDDGEEYVAVRTIQSAVEAVTAVDEARLWVLNTTTGSKSGVFFVLGNDPEEVICDYHLSLSYVLDPLTEGWWDA